MISDHVIQLCQEDSVSSILAREPTEAPGDIAKRLFRRRRSSSVSSSGSGSSSPDHRHGENFNNQSEDEALKRAKACGKWGSANPSDLFLRAYADALQCLDSNPLAGMVSPSLMGSHGTMPLTAVAPLADIIRHCSNVIARAEREVFFLTCTWSPSVAQELLRNSLLELSARAQQRDPNTKVVVKIMFDKAGLQNALDPHQVIKPESYTSKGTGLPSPEQIPGIDLEVISLHRLPLGTLHCKFCVVDRKLAVVMSNNVENNANMEMMTHVEGPIVDSIYDTALLTWHKTFNPPLPFSRTPAPESLPETSHGAVEANQTRIAEEGEAVAASDEHHGEGMPEHTPEDPHYDASLADEVRRMQSCYSCKKRETRLQAANRQLNLSVPNPVDASGPEVPDGQEMTPYISTMTSHPIPMAVVSRAAHAGVDTSSVHVPQNAAFLSLIRNAQKSIFIQTPNLNAKPLLPALRDALARGVDVTYYVCFGYNDAGEMIPTQGGTNEQAAGRLISSLMSTEDESAHEQSGEGTRASFAQLRSRLHIHYYVAKDQRQPIHQSLKSRACHIKLLIADGAVGIQGSGNQDTQSWYHSQELNLLVDSAEVCAQWREGIERNQNTRVFGEMTGNDGVWRDQDGRAGHGYPGDLGLMGGLVHGVLGMYKKTKAARG